MIGTSDLIAGLLLTGICALAWRRRKSVGAKAWAFRILPIGVFLLPVFYKSAVLFWGDLLITLFVYVFAVYRSGWRLKSPKNRFLNGVWWAIHVVVYFLLAFIVCGPMVGVVRLVVRYSPLATDGDWPWTKGEITAELPFAIEYKRHKTFCAEYDKRILFKSGKRIGLLIDTCGFGPYRVFRLKDGNYCLVDGYNRNYSKSFESMERYLRVDVVKETVEMKHVNWWFMIPEEGYVRGWGGVSDDTTKGMDHFFFDMYSGGDLNGKGWTVEVKGTPIGDSLEGMELIGEIDTMGSFKGLKRRLGD